MDFNSAFNNYKSGTATEEERQLVESEIQKSRLINEYLDEEILPMPELNELEDMKLIRRRLRRRSAAIVAVSIVLCIAIFAGIFYGIVPAVEKSYWNPAEAELGIPYSSDLDMTLSAYSELFCPYTIINHASVSRRGFADYDITVSYWDRVKGGELSYANLNLDKGELSLPIGFPDFVPVNVFNNSGYPNFELEDDTKAHYYEALSDLPDYLNVDAAVSFSRDMSMEELIELNDKLQETYGANIFWVGIRNCDKDRLPLTLTGMTPFSGGLIRENVNEKYPCLEIKGEEMNEENLMQHFKSLLQFSKERLDMGKSLPESPDAEFYDRVLSYVEENGLNCYGVYISAPPSVFIELLDSGIASQVWPEGAWIRI